MHVDERGTAVARAGRPAVICLTPVRNEAWILERFLRCASLWADHIVVADQGSTDGSREIAQAFDKVRLVENATPAFNEPERQRLLIDAAREIPGPRLLLALDADEVITGNWSTSAEWRRMMEAQPGTIVHFRWVNLLPGLQRCSVTEQTFPWGFMDDESPHVGAAIHSPRVPLPAGAPSLVMNEVKVLHYAFTDWSRYLSRQVGYQCWEIINHPRRSPSDIYRQYHRNLVLDFQTQGVDRGWFEFYEGQGIDMTTVLESGRYDWDRQVLEWMQEHGPRSFRRVDMWEVDWTARAEQWGMTDYAVRDPRSPLDRLVLGWLRRTQRYSRRAGVRHVDRSLRLFGW